MKNLISITLVLALLLALAACGGDTPAPSSSARSGNAPSSTAPASPDAGTPPPQDTEKLVADEIERMRAEEETRLTALPELPNIETGEYEIIEFGGYDWRLLDIVGDRALLISDKILMDAICNEYFPTILVDGIPWEKWELRAYLNGEFYNSFSAEDRAKIVTVSNTNRVNYSNEISEGPNTQDNIFLLSVEEAARYFGGDYDVANNAMVDDYRYFGNRVAVHLAGGTFTTYDWNNNPSTYTVEAGAAHTWLLRSPGSYTEGATFVDEEGRIDTHGQPVTFSEGVRPALWMRFEASADIAPRTVTVLPSATNELARLSAGDTASAGANTMELLLNSQSTLKMDASTNVTIKNADAFSLSLTVDSGAVLTDITRLRNDDRYEITAGDLTFNVKGTTFVVENNDTPRIIMLEGSGMINGEMELNEGLVATVENGNVMQNPLVIDESLSTVALDGILANINNFSLETAEYEKLMALINERFTASNTTTNVPSTSSAPAPESSNVTSTANTDKELAQGEVFVQMGKMEYRYNCVDGIPQPMGEYENGTIMAYMRQELSTGGWSEWEPAPHYWAGLRCTDCGEESNKAAWGASPDNHPWSGEWDGSPRVFYK